MGTALPQKSEIILGHRVQTRRPIFEAKPTDTVA